MSSDSKFKIISNNSVLIGHKCSKCTHLLIIPFSCKMKLENGCTENYCQDCMKGRGKCEQCQGVFERNKIMENIINERYKVACKSCSHEMLPNLFNQHLLNNCKIEKSNNQDIPKSKEENDEFTIEESNIITKESKINLKEKVGCVGESFGEYCKETGEKMKILYHQLECNKVDKIKPIEYPLYSRLIYLLIGVGEYDDVRKNLDAPRNDVEEMKICLEKIGFEKNGKNILTNKSAKKSVIEDFLDRLREEMEGSNKDEKFLNSHSMILFYFSGHGIEDEQEEIYQICPHDFQFQTRENGIDLQFLVESLFKINCMHVLIVLDSCFGGGIFR